MKRANGRLWLITGWAALGLSLTTLGACVKPNPNLFEYTYNKAVVEAGPPVTPDAAITEAEDFSSFPEIEVEPEEIRGYEDLPVEIRNLYGPDPLRVGLGEIVYHLLQNNREIRIQGYTLRIDEYEIPIEKSIYDLLLEADAEVSKDITPTASELQTGDRRERTFEATASQLFPTGGVLSLFYVLNRVNQDFAFATLNPAYTTAAGVLARQPLLRGFGPARTNAGIHIAQHDYKASAAELESEIEERLAEALQTYWALVAAVYSYDVQVISYTAALDLLRVNRAKVEAGVLAQTEVLQAQAQAEQRRDLVVRVRQRVRDLEDQLKQLVFFQEGIPFWSAEIYPTQGLVWREVEIDPEALVAQAMEERAEIRAARQRVVSAQIAREAASQDRLPRLDLTGSYSFNGLDDSVEQSHESLTTYDYDSGSIGLEFSFPLQNRQRRYRFAQSVERFRQLEEILEQTKDLVLLDIRTAVRELNTARERIDITRARVESEQANLAAELRRYEVGVSTSFEVLEFQEDLAAAQEAFIEAVVDYNRAAIAIERARGTLLESYGVTFMEPELDPVLEPVFFPVGLD